LLKKMRVGDQRQASAALTPGKRLITCFNVGWGTAKPVGKGVENLALTGTWSPDRRTRRDSLCWLRYPGPIFCIRNLL